MLASSTRPFGPRRMDSTKKIREMVPLILIISTVILSFSPVCFRQLKGLASVCNGFDVFNHNPEHGCCCYCTMFRFF